MTLQVLAPTKDTYIDSTMVSTIFGAAGELFLRRGSDNVRHWMLLEFDLSSVTDKLVSAILKLNIETSDNLAINWAIYRLRRLNWVEGDATWQDYRILTQWTTSGAESTVSDRDTSISLTGTLPADTTGWYFFGDIGAHAQDAIDNHSGVMAIIVVQTALEGNALWKFHSKENGDSSLIPRLVVSSTKLGFLLYE